MVVRTGFIRHTQETVVVHVSDDVADELGLGGRNIEKTDLFREVILQRLRPRRHILHGVVLLIALFVHAIARRTLLFVKMVFPILAQRFEAVEIQLIGMVLVNDEFGGAGIARIFGSFVLRRIVDLFTIRRGGLLFVGGIAEFEDRIF